MTFSEKGMLERRQIIEDALERGLQCIGEIVHDKREGRCLAVPPECGREGEYLLYSLWDIACEIERLIE